MILALCLFVSGIWNAAADDKLSVADIFGHDMVLQTDKPIPVWGRGVPGKNVTVQFNSTSQSTKVNPDSSWTLNLPAMTASSSPSNLTVTSDETIEFSGILVGEVWYASGQSNMGWTMNASARKLDVFRKLIDEGDYPMIRYRSIRTKDSAQELSRLGDGGQWKLASPGTVGQFSGVAYLFARELFNQLEVPIGIIESSWGGHPIEPFIPVDEFSGHPVLDDIQRLAQIPDFKGLKNLNGGVYARDPSWLPGRIYNSRVAPVAPFAIKGFIWYQAESNCGTEEDPNFYHVKMNALIDGWRKSWNSPDLPFYFVQLPQYPSKGWVMMRDEQRRSTTIPHTGMVVTSDLELDEIHPANKLEVAQRLSFWPLARQYGKKLIPSGPLFDKLEIINHEAFISFRYAHGCLLTASKNDFQPVKFTKPKMVNGFEVCGNDGVWYKATATIQCETVVCDSKMVPNPVAVRYGWAPTQPTDAPWNLYNAYGLPASPFISHPEMAPYDPHTQ